MTEGSAVSVDRRREVEAVVERALAWASSEPTIVGLALVGSWAAGRAREDSDVDLVVVTRDVDRFVESGDWIGELGADRVVRTADWGALTERRLATASGLEVEVGFVDPAWAATEPVDDGTRRVVRDGFRVVLDRERRLAALGAACGVAAPARAVRR